MVGAIKKPRGKEWPDPLELEVQGVPIRIEYKNQKVMFPKEVNVKKAEAIGFYMVNEGLIVFSEETKND
jgi:hypothetical protein